MKGVLKVAKPKKTTRIKNEKSRLFEIFADLEPNKLDTCRALIDRAAFLTISLQDLEELLNENGWVEPYKNGSNQEGFKPSAAANVHVSLTKNLNSIMKLLLDLVPPAKRRSKLDELMNS